MPAYINKPTHYTLTFGKVLASSLNDIEKRETFLSI